jgi:TonB family protein
MTNRRKLVAASALALLAALPPPLFARRHHILTNPPADSPTSPFLIDPFSMDSSEDAPRVLAEKSGTLPTKDGLRLRFNTNLGNVRILTDAKDQVSYHVTVEADLGDAGAEKVLPEFSVVARQTPAGIALDGQVPWRTFRGPFRVNFEVHVPLRYNLDATTQAGNIDVQDIDGRVALVTAGGNITVGRVGGRDTLSHPAPGTTAQVAARLETQGGHITIGDVTGDLRATTAGGHIMTGNIEGDAILHTGGGHIHTGRVAGAATLDTGGGNIHVRSAGSSVTANTAGGQIDFGAAAGIIRAHTGGGAVRIERFSGPTAVEASGGSLFLRQVDGPLRVSAATGNITAWFTDNTEPGAMIAAKGVRKMRGASQLTSGNGDIIVYLPRELAVTIDAVVKQGGAHRIVADLSLPLRVSCQDSASGVRALHCEGSLNGGGEILHLKAVSGNILLKLGEPNSWTSPVIPAPWKQAVPEPPSAPSWNSAEARDDNGLDAEGFIEEVRRKIQESWWGSVPVDPDELQKLLEHPVAPVYPEVARKAGIEGDVVLRAYVSSDGRVTNLRVLAGPPILARAAIDAVQQWRYQPVKMNGRATNVVTTLIVAFRLQ